MMAPYTPEPTPYRPEGRRAAEAPGRMREEGNRQAAPDRAEEDASRAVMHPERHDPDWRYYFGAWGG